MVRRRPTRNAGFSLVEMLLAVFILGIGVISIAALFPAGIVLQRQAADDIVGPIVVKNAFATIRSKLDQSDFGRIEDFGFSPQYLGSGGVAGTVRPLGGSDIPQVSGDWGWMRPGFLFGTAANQNDAGTIDVFSAAYTRSRVGLPSGVVGTLATEISEDVAPGPLFGIPYNVSKYPLYSLPAAARPTDPLLQQLLEPAVTFTQAERSWPQGNPKYGTASSIPQSTYYWDCMFRRNGGRIQVAVFVYRVNIAGGDTRPYTVGPFTAASGAGGLPSGAFDGTPTTPPMPAMYLAPNFDNGLLPTSWPVGQGVTPADEIPGTGINQANSFGSAEQVWDDWQAPGSWWIDNHGTVHRVLVGRNSVQQGPVKLVRPIPAVPRSPVNGVSPTVPPQQKAANHFISAIWFIPRRDARGNVITPVFAAVEEL